MDIAPIASGQGDSGLPHSTELIEFVDAFAGCDGPRLSAAREQLGAVAGDAFTVDAAAVAANFEMMTRVADATGATLPADMLSARAELVAALGFGHRLQGAPQPAQRDNTRNTNRSTEAAQPTGASPPTGPAPAAEAP